MADDIAGTLTVSSPDGKTYETKFCYGPNQHENLTFTNLFELSDYLKHAMGYVTSVQAKKEIKKDMKELDDYAEKMELEEFEIPEYYPNK